MYFTVPVALFFVCAAYIPISCLWWQRAVYTHTQERAPEAHWLHSM